MQPPSSAPYASVRPANRSANRLSGSTAAASTTGRSGTRRKGLRLSLLPQNEDVLDLDLAVHVRTEVLTRRSNSLMALPRPAESGESVQMPEADVYTLEVARKVLRVEHEQ